MAVWKLLLGFAIIATAYGQPAIKMKFNPNGMNLSKLHQRLFVSHITQWS